jgi:hypothetical protein
VLEQLGVQRVLEARDAARYRCVIDAYSPAAETD